MPVTGHERVHEGMYARIRVGPTGTTKEYFGHLHETAANEVIGHHSKYLEWLRKAGVDVAATSLGKVKEDKGFRIRAEQGTIADEHFLDTVMRNGGHEATNALNELLGTTFKVVQANRGTELERGFDVAPRNFALVDHKLVYVDTYPVLLRKDGKIITPQYKTHLRAKSSGPIQKGLTTVLRNVIPREDFGAGRLFARILTYSRNLSPGQAEAHEKLIRDFCQNHLEPPELDEFNKQTTPRALRSRALKFRVATRLFRKG